VRLHVGVLGAEERLDPVAGEVLDVVDDLVAAVVALAGIALGVLVGEHRAGGLHHGRRREVLRGDELQPVFWRSPRRSMRSKSSVSRSVGQVMGGSLGRG
jgi:hypothetical protein